MYNEYVCECVEKNKMPAVWYHFMPFPSWLLIMMIAVD